MKKKEYMKPEQRIVELRHRTMILAGSLTDANTNMTDDDDIDISGTPGSTWGR